MAMDDDARTDRDGEGLPTSETRMKRYAGRRRWFARPLLVIAAVTMVAGGLRFYHVSSPHQYVFDEVYYAKDGCLDAGFPYKDCELTAPNEQTATVHPPLGRWTIAAGEKLFGNRPFGWRVASATFGTLSVGMLALLVYLLWGSVLWAGVAGLLLATENLNFVQSRTSMLDIFLAAFVVAGFLFLVADRRWIERRTPPPAGTPAEGSPDEEDEEYLLALPPDRPPSPILRPWRIAAGVAFGAATATKWSGGTALIGAIILALAWERTRRRRIGLPSPFREALRDEAFGVFVFLVILPLIVYVASYGAWFADHGLDVGAWWKLQRGMADYSLSLRAKHPYSSPAWTWLLIRRPVSYYYECMRMRNGSCASPQEILGMGNPFVFWTSIVTIPYAALVWIRRRDWRGGLVTVSVLIQYLPWFFAARTNFIFYMTPVSPFLVVALTLGLRDLSEARIGEERTRALAPIAAFAVIAAVGMFVFFLPVLTGRTLSYAAWKARIWLPSWI